MSNNFFCAYVNLEIVCYWINTSDALSENWHLVKTEFIHGENFSSKLFEANAQVLSIKSN